MAKRWKNRPEGSNWGEFGDEDQHGRMNYITAERRLAALKEVKTGQVFTLSHPLDKPGGTVLNPNRKPPVFHPVFRGKETYFNLPSAKIDPRFNDVGSDEAIMLYMQYSTHWDGFAHKGSRFDADGDGIAEKVSYNGWQLASTKKPGFAGAAASAVAGMYPEIRWPCFCSRVATGGTMTFMPGLMRSGRGMRLLLYSARAALYRPSL